MIVMGTIPYGGSGCLCSSIAMVKLLIGFIASGDNDFVMVDSQAGVEIFGRGLASEFGPSRAVMISWIRERESKRYNFVKTKYSKMGEEDEDSIPSSWNNLYRVYRRGVR